MLRIIENHPKFTLKVDEENKIFLAETRGFFSEEDGQASLKAYQKVLSMITPSEYILILNTENLETSGEEASIILKGCFLMYKAQKYKKIKLIEMSSKIAFKQVKKIIKEVDVDVEFIKGL